MTSHIDLRQIEIPINDDRQGQEIAQSNSNSPPGSKPIDKNTSHISGATVLPGHPVDPRNDENSPNSSPRSIVSTSLAASFSSLCFLYFGKAGKETESKSQ